MIIPGFMRAGFAILLTATAASVAVLYMNAQTAAWYISLSKPTMFAPAFSFVVLALVTTYTLMAIASSLVWMHDQRPHDFRGWVPLYFVHLLVHTAWMVLFFGYHFLFLAIIAGFFMAFFALMLTLGAWESHRLASYLLMPYLAWTLYALCMTVALWGVN